MREQKSSMCVRNFMIVKLEGLDFFILQEKIGHLTSTDVKSNTKHMLGPSYLSPVSLWRGGQHLTLHGHFTLSSVWLSSSFNSLCRSLGGGSPLKMQRHGRTRRLEHLNESLSPPLYSAQFGFFFCFLFFVLHLMPYLCFIFIHFTVFSLLLIPSLYSWLTSGQFSFSLLFPALFCCSAQSSPSYPPCLLQLPEIISRLAPFP